MKSTFPTPGRALEYIAFFKFKIPTREGTGYVFMAYDAYTDKLFNLGVEKTDKPEAVLKNIYLLLEDPLFENYHNEGFTLVLEEFQELEPRILEILKPVNGKALFDKKYNNVLVNPVLAQLLQYFRER